MGVGGALKSFPSSSASFAGLDWEQRAPAVHKGEFVVFMNEAGHFLCVRVVDVKVKSRGAECNLLKFEYRIYHTGVVPTPLFPRSIKKPSTQSHKKVQLWADGPYWADTNIGAEKPWEYGYYFWWGDTVGYKRVNDAWVASDGSVSGFSFDTRNKSKTPTNLKDFHTLRRERWVTTSNVLTPEHDAAHVQWGGEWRMPTDQEIGDLSSKCDWIWAAMNGVDGYFVRGRGDYVAASIFLPCAGYGRETLLDNVGTGGSYWSSVPRSGKEHAVWLSFDSENRYGGGSGRVFGFTIRPVQDSAKKQPK